MGVSANKRNLIQAVIVKLQNDLALYHKAAGAARAEATHEQSKAENKYDTRGLEASYLARGQSRHAAELALAIEQFQKLRDRELAPNGKIDLGSAVDLKGRKETATYLIGPRAGGTEVQFDGREVFVITPESPLGAQLIGRKIGEECALEIGGEKQRYKIAEVW
jgi:hypothetical protein